MKFCIPILLSISCVSQAGAPDDAAERELNDNNAEGGEGVAVEPSGGVGGWRGAGMGGGEESGEGGAAGGMGATNGTAGKGGFVAGAQGDGGGAGALSGGGGCPAYPPETELTVTAMPAHAKPVYLVPTLFTAFGSQVTRIGDANEFARDAWRINGRSPNPVHHYAKTQPWNSDGSLVMLQGWPSALLDGKRFNIIKTFNPPNEHHTWLNTDPKTLIGVQRPRSVVKMNVDTGRMQTLREFTEYDSVSFGNWEGNVSNDDRYMALQARKGTAVTVLVYDVIGNAIASTLDGGTTFPNNVTMSQSGKYLVVQWNVSGTGTRQGVSLHSTENGSFLRNLSNQGGSHFDLCKDSQGEEVLVMAEDKSPALNMVRLRDGVRTRLVAPERTGYSIHVSCRNLNLPGWAFISQFARDVTTDRPKAYYQTIYAAKLDGSGKVMRYAHEYHSENADYEHQNFAVPNRDGNVVMWRSDWLAAEGPVESYVARTACAGTVR